MKKILFTALVALFAVTGASAQDRGTWGIGPKMSIYTNTGTTIFGLGAAARYSFTDNVRIEPSITALFEDYCSVDISADVHYLFKIAPEWKVYPLAGLSVNEIGDWALGINLGGGVDFSVARNWDVSAGLKWLVQTRSGWPNPVVFNLGATYKF